MKNLINATRLLKSMHTDLCAGIRCKNCTMCTDDGGCAVEEWIDKFPSAEQTENSSEKPNNCEDLQDWKDRMWAEAIVTEPTISKMEQVEGEPQTERSE